MVDDLWWRFRRTLQALRSSAGRKSTFRSGTYLPFVESLETRATPASINLAPSADNTLYQVATADPAQQLSDGAGQHFYVGETNQASNALRRGAIKFDLSAVPAGSTITSVVLTLSMSKSVNGAENVDLHRALLNWGEGTSNAALAGRGGEGVGIQATTGDVTWFYTFFSTQRWTTPGGDFVATASASTSVNGVGSYQWTGAGLAADVQQWLDNPGTNFGWILTGNETASQTVKQFDTAANTTSSARPVLTVSYTPPAPAVPSLTIAKSHTDIFRQGDAADTYSLTVTNTGPGPTTGTVTVTDTVPTGLAPTAADSGSINGWSVTASGQTITATRSDMLAAGMSYPVLMVTVSVASAAPASVTNTATVAGGGAVNTASASDPTTIVPPGAGVISGTVFHDFNTDGVREPGEPGLAGQTVFLDLDGSGILQPSDPTALTDANGNYELAVPSAGGYTVRQFLFGGVLLSAPASGSYQVTVADGATVSGQNFADVLTSIAVPLTLPPSVPFPAQGNANADYVEAVYRAVLDRNADPGGLANWTAQLNSGALSRLQVVQGIRNSVEHFTQEVSDFYLTLLNRPADPAGLQNWVQQLEAGMREEQVAFFFLDSPEYLSKGDKHFVDAMYQSLLGRTFDPAGEAAWLNQLGDDSSGNPTHPATLTHEQVITAFLFSTESETRLTEGYYEVFLERPADAAGLSGWLGHLQQGAPFLSIGEQFLASDEFYNRAAQQG
jgi:uncharacterized repeat protein (TIGR01451 family)